MRFLVVLLLILMFAAGVAAVYLWYSMEKPYGAIPPDGVFVEIPHGTSQRGVAHILKNEGLIRSALAFELYSRRQKKRTLVAGEYFSTTRSAARKSSGKSPMARCTSGLYRARRRNYI